LRVLTTVRAAAISGAGAEDLCGFAVDLLRSRAKAQYSDDGRLVAGRVLHQALERVDATKPDISIDREPRFVIAAL
jgi:hypothetical protein